MPEKLKYEHREMEAAKQKFWSKYDEYRPPVFLRSFLLLRTIFFSRFSSEYFECRNGVNTLCTISPRTIPVTIVADSLKAVQIISLLFSILQPLISRTTVALSRTDSCLLLILLTRQLSRFVRSNVRINRGSYSQDAQSYYQLMSWFATAYLPKW